MRFGILAAVLFSSTIGLMPSSIAQNIPQDLEEQSPPLTAPRFWSWSAPLPCCGMLSRTMKEESVTVPLPVVTRQCAW